MSRGRLAPTPTGYLHVGHARTFALAAARASAGTLLYRTEDLDAVLFDLGLCEAILEGYLSAAKETLNNHDFDYIYDAIHLITFELGLRFLTDHLAGNIYFKVNRPDHNLHRAQVQFKLVESIEQQETIIRAIVERLRP